VKGDYAPSMLNMEGSQAIVDGVVADVHGIGYVGVGYVKDESGELREGISIVSVAKDTVSPAVSPLDKEKVLSGAYPIVRPIYQYLKELPIKGSPIEALLLFEASQEGQAILEETGFYPPISADNAQNKVLFDAIQ
jgi:phosphate transport system substrate-binding protein